MTLRHARGPSSARWARAGVALVVLSGALTGCAGASGEPLSGDSGAVCVPGDAAGSATVVSAIRNNGSRPVTITDVVSPNPGLVLREWAVTPIDPAADRMPPLGNLSGRHLPPARYRSTSIRPGQEAMISAYVQAVGRGPQEVDGLTVDYTADWERRITTAKNRAVVTHGTSCSTIS